MDTVQHHYNELRARLGRLRCRAALLAGMQGLVAAVAAALGLGLLWALLEAALYLSPPARAGLGLVAALLAVSAGAWKLKGLVPHLLSTHRFARHVEAIYPRLAQQVSSALALWQDNRAAELYSPELIAATVQDAAAALRALDTHRLLDRRPLMAGLRRLGVAGGVLGLSLALSPTLRQAAERCAHPLSAYERRPDTRVSVEPGDQSVIKGEDATMLIRFAGELPRTARVRRRRSSEEPWQHEEIVVNRADSTYFQFTQVNRPVDFQVLAGDGSSAVHRITVIDPPRVQRLRLDLQYPEYTGLAPRREEDTGDIRALTGTTVDLTVFASKPLAQAAVVLDDSVTMRASVSGRQARATMRITRDAYYHIELTDAQGVANREPIRYTVEVIQDASPQVQISAPGQDMDLPESMQLLVAIEASDDFAIADVELVHRVNDGPEQRQSLPFTAGPEVHLTHAWDLSGNDLLPEDRVFYRAEVEDNDRVSGPKRSASREFVLRFPSLYELYEEATEAHEEQLDGLEELAEQGRETGEYLEKMRRKVLKREDLTWEQRQELEATIEREADRSRAVEELGQKLEETLEKLEANGLSSEELLEKMAEVRKLMAEVLSPELRRSLEELQEALASEDPRQLAEALREFNQDQQAFQERLDRTIAMLEQVQVEQRLEAVVRQARDLAERQGQINSELGPEAAAERLAAQEDALQRDTDRLQQELRDLEQAMEPFSEQAADKLESQAGKMAEHNFSERMGKMSQQMQARANQQARRQGDALEQDLSEFAASLQQLQQEFVADQKKLLAEDLRRAMRGLLDLSARQEALRDSVLTAPVETAANLAQEQFALTQGVGQIAESLGAVSRRTMAVEHPLAVTLGYALRSTQEAARHLSQRTSGRAVHLQHESVRYMNEGVLLLRQSLQNLAQSSMPSSFAEAMQKMLGLSEQQAQLNEATEQALRDAQRAGRSSQAMGAQMPRLAAEQRRIYEALEQLRRDVRGMGGAEKRVGAIEEEVEDVVEDMQRQRLTQQTLERQQHILQRMLDASRSIHTQGEDERRRRSRTGEDQEYAGPAWLPDDLGQSYDALRDAMQRALRAPYPDEYRSAIQHYYEQLYQDARNGEQEEDTRQ